MTFPSKGGPVQSDFEGLVLKFNRLYIQRDSSELSERTLNHVKIYYAWHMPVMQGTRLSQSALSRWINGYNIAECAAMEIGELREVILNIKEPVVASMVASLAERLQRLDGYGAGLLDAESGDDHALRGESRGEDG